MQSKEKRAIERLISVGFAVTLAVLALIGVLVWIDGAQTRLAFWLVEGGVAALALLLAYLYRRVQPLLHGPVADVSEPLLKTGALQDAIFNSANFSSIATDAQGVIQIFNVGAERMLGYEAADVVDKITPAGISDAQEVVARAAALSLELDTPITPGFEALVFKASRGIEDIYELTYIR